MNRNRLPDRRKSELVDFVHNIRRWTLTEDCRHAELFLDAAKVDPLSELALAACRTDVRRIFLLTRAGADCASGRCFSAWVFVERRL